ncbi:MAG: hypothetical protein HW405_469 [Candidatus Berkelbacteria bacterium]|nr:hypothetical protein [Candidatus Berkelbacteria bacterium]
MFLSSRKKVTLGIIGIFLIFGLGFFGWQVKSGHLFSRADTASSGQTFSDVPITHWAYLYIEAAFRGGIVGGYPGGVYKPDEIVKRDAMAVFIARAVTGGDAKVPAGPATASFPDVPTTYWAFKYIEYVKTKGIAGGYADGKYHPEYQVDRASMAVFISRAIAGTDAAVPAGPATATFKDVPTNHWAYKYIEYLSSQQIVGGYADGTYHPTEKVNRAAMAVFITKAFNLISTALVANISGRVTTSTGTPLANAYIVIDDGDDVVQTDTNGNYIISGLDATTYEVEVYDSGGSLYESSNLDTHIISPGFGNNTINFSGLVKK